MSEGDSCIFCQNLIYWNNLISLISIKFSKNTKQKVWSIAKQWIVHLARKTNAKHYFLTLWWWWMMNWVMSINVMRVDRKNISQKIFHRKYLKAYGKLVVCFWNIWLCPLNDIILAIKISINQLKTSIVCIQGTSNSIITARFRLPRTLLFKWLHENLIHTCNDLKAIFESHVFKILNESILKRKIIVS